MDIISNIINGLILIATTIAITMLSTKARIEKFLNWFNEHRMRNIVLASVFLIIIFGLTVANLFTYKDENPTQTLINQIKHDTQEFTLLNLKYSQITAQKDSLQNSYFLVRAERDSLANLIALKQNQKADITRQIDRKQDEKSKLNEQLLGLDVRNVNQTDALKYKINQLEIEIQTLKTQKERLENEIEGLEHEKKGLNNKIEDLTKSLANSNRERQKLESELKKANTELATRVAESDSVLRILAAKPGQFKQTHQIAWSPDRRWLAILFTSRKITRLLVFDAFFRNLFLDSLLHNCYQTMQFAPDGENIMVDQVIIDFRKKASAGIFRSYPDDLSYDEVKNMLKKHDFYDSGKNPTGRGFQNKFEAKTIHNDRIVIDHASGLMWQQSRSKHCLYVNQVQSYIDSLNQVRYAGYNDWRLPTLEEAMSLVEPQRNHFGYHIDDLFDYEPYWWIWTIDSNEGASRWWVVYFNYGGCDEYNVIDSTLYVRFVRSGHSLSGR